jgi:hypothetical protein
MHAPSASSRPRRRPFARPLTVTIAALACLALPSTALAQATRTWVSGTGDDANPCSRTAPCKTFAGAISKTIAGGEIDAIDPGGYGALTITKSITIDGGAGQVASVLVNGANGIVVSAGSTDRVILRNLRFEGNAQSANAGLNGVRFLSGQHLWLDNDVIQNFGQNGVDFASSQANSRLDLNGTTIENVNGNGVNVTSSGNNLRVGIANSTIEGAAGDGIHVTQTTGTPARVTVSSSHVDGNHCGLVLGGTCGSSGAGTGVAVVGLGYDSTFNDNSAAGLFVAGTTGVAIIGRDVISDNTNGLQGSGSVISFGNNLLGGNVTDGSTSSTIVTHARDLAQANRLGTARAQAMNKARKRKHAQQWRRTSRGPGGDRLR